MGDHCELLLQVGRLKRRYVLKKSCKVNITKKKSLFMWVIIAATYLKQIQKHEGTLFYLRKFLSYLNKLFAIT